jgi:ADP-ribosylglycohydrolase
MDSQQKNLAYHLIKGVLLGDAFGAGWEMKSREFMLRNLNKLDSQLVDRDPGFNVDYTPGDPTDDTEMTLGTYFAILNNTKPTEADFVKSWYDVHLRLKQLNGHPTIGHGNFIDYCNDPTSATMDRLCKKQAAKPLVSGNAPVMRCSPLTLLDDPVEAAIRSALATHPTAYTALSTLLLVLAGKFYLSHDANENQQIVPYLLGKLTKLEPTIRRLLNEDKYVLKNSIDAAFTDVIDTLKMVDAQPEPKDPLGNDINHRLLVGPEPSEILGTETGLNGGSFRTFVCALFCLKWADNTTLWQNLRRVILFGGDVDTLAACVMPFVYTKMCLTEKADLPLWVVQGINWKNLSLLD